jgi:SNF2 family DNA or RNA helicase
VGRCSQFVHRMSTSDASRRTKVGERLRRTSDGSMVLGGSTVTAYHADETAPELALYAPLLSRLHAGDPIADERSRLVDAAVAQTIRPGFEQLQSLGRLRFEPFPYQLAAAQRALARLRGRAILADEVGLGKTIEAALVLSELYVRRLARRTLVLVPAGLVEQWCEELDRKFALPLLMLGGDAWTRALRPWEAPIVVASLATARRARGGRRSPRSSGTSSLPTRRTG